MFTPPFGVAKDTLFFNESFVNIEFLLDGLGGEVASIERWLRSWSVDLFIWLADFLGGDIDF